MNKSAIFLNGIFDENPIFVQFLGMCPTLAVTTSVVNGIGMGIATTTVLVGSNLVISMLKKIIPEKIRIPSYVVIIAGFVTIIDMLLKAYIPSLSNSLGIFIPLIVVNCIVLARAESFASKNTVTNSILDGLGMGIGFTGALVIISAIREIIGNGTILNFHIMGEHFKPALLAVLPPGAFIILGLLVGAINLIKMNRGKNNA